MASSLTALVFQLPPVQDKVFHLVDEYHATYQRPCSASFVAGLLNRDPSTIREHFIALHRKGWLIARGNSAIPNRLQS